MLNDASLWLMMINAILLVDKWGFFKKAPKVSIELQHFCHQSRIGCLDSQRYFKGWNLQRVYNTLCGVIYEHGALTTI